MFFLVSGASGSGKTTLIRNLAGTDPTLEVHDADERLIDNEFTRCQQLEEWIQLAVERQAHGIDFLLGANSPLGELLACPSAIRLEGIAGCLLDCRDRDRITRLRDRGIDPRWPPNQHHLNWAAWHRMHAWDPAWEQHVITKNGPTTHDYTRWTPWKEGDPRWRTALLDTSQGDAQDTMDGIVRWVGAAAFAPNALTPETRWWE